MNLITISLMELRAMLPVH